MIKPDTVKAGDVLYAVARVKMGNTTMSRTAHWRVDVIEVLPGAPRRFRVLWNGNERIYTDTQIRRLRRTPPMVRP